MQLITEHSATVQVTLPERDPTRKQEVFYNPMMASNRNISILLLNTITKSDLKIADPLAGSGIRSLRFLKELKKGKIQEIHANDHKENFKHFFEDNLRLNKIKKSRKIKISCEDANLSLLHSQGFDYIDIDPFGSPNPFLAAAIARISREGILAVTATDTAALTGTYPKVTQRKYWAASLKNYLMHETGLRILIRKVQLQGIQFDKALFPILSYHKDHYFRAYFRVEKGKEKCDEIVLQHQYFLSCGKCLSFKVSKYNKEECCGKRMSFAGPLWSGRLTDEKLITEMARNNPFSEEQKFLDLLAEESIFPEAGFYDLHALARKHKKEPPRMELALKMLEGTRTHFCPTGIKTKREVSEIVGLLR